MMVMDLVIQTEEADLEKVVTVFQDPEGDQKIHGDQAKVSDFLL